MQTQLGCSPLLLFRTAVELDRFVRRYVFTIGFIRLDPVFWTRLSSGFRVVRSKIEGVRPHESLNLISIAVVSAI